MEESGKGTITRKQWAILGALMLGVLMGALDISIVSPAIPVITQELGVTGRQISWIITLYLLVYVVATPLMSALSDRYGRKVVFLADVVIFGLGSLWAALSPSLAHLLSARGIQALGAGGLFPIASTVVGEVFPKERRGMALGFIGMIWGVAAIVGPLVGGWLTQGFGWQSIFYLNLPIALILLIYAGRTLPRDEGVHAHPLDLGGMAFLGGGLATLTYGLNQIQSGDILGSLGSVVVWPWLAAAVVFLSIFAAIEGRARAPVVSLGLFRKRQLDIGLVLAFAGGVAEAGLAFLPFYAVAALGVSTGSSGTLVLATAITIFLCTEPAGQMVDRLGAKPILLLGTLVTGGGALLMATANSLAAFIGYQVVLGIGLSALLGTPVRYVALSETNDMERASAQSLVSLGGSFGAMIGSTLAGAFLASHTEGLAGFHNIYLAVAAAAALGFLLALGLRSRRTAEQPARAKETTNKSSSEEERKESIRHPA
jgi:EmrB/QacA subfamily drug resistance transporter